MHRDGHELPVELTITPLRLGGRTVFSAFLREIGERREAEAARRLLASVVDGSDDAIVARDLDGTVRSWNAGAERVLGYPAADMIGRSIAPVWREDRLLFERMQARLAAGERVPSFDARAVRGDGTVIDVSVTASPLKDELVHVTGVSVIFRDIRERRTAEASSRLLSALVESSEDAILAGSVDGTVSMWNPGAERLYGYTAEEMVGQSIARVRPEGDLGEVEPVQTALARGERVATFETRERRKDGTLIDVSVSLSPVRDAAGEVVGVSSIVRDVSDRKRAERDLEQASRRFASAFENAPTGMALVDPNGSWLAVNASLCRLLGRSQAELLATTSKALTHPDDLDSDSEHLDRTLAGQMEGYELEKRYLRPDGEAVWGKLSVSLVRDGQGQPVSPRSRTSASARRPRSSYAPTATISPSSPYTIRLRGCATIAISRSRSTKSSSARDAMAGRGAWCSSTYRALQTSTMGRGAWRATGCWARSAPRSSGRVALLTVRRVSAATSSRCCCPRPAPAPRPTPRAASHARSPPTQAACR